MDEEVMMEKEFERIEKEMEREFNEAEKVINDMEQTAEDTQEESVQEESVQEENVTDEEVSDADKSDINVNKSDKDNIDYEAFNDNNKKNVIVKIASLLGKGIVHALVYAATLVGDVVRAVVFGNPRPFNYEKRLEAEERLKEVKENNKRTHNVYDSKDRSPNNEAQSENKKQEERQADNKEEKKEENKDETKINISDEDILAKLRGKSYNTFEDVSKDTDVMCIVKEITPYSTRKKNGFEQSGLSVTCYDGRELKTWNLPDYVVDKLNINDIKTGAYISLTVTNNKGRFFINAVNDITEQASKAREELEKQAMETKQEEAKESEAKEETKEEAKDEAKEEAKEEVKEEVKEETTKEEVKEEEPNETESENTEEVKKEETDEMNSFVNEAGEIFNDITDNPTVYEDEPLGNGIFDGINNEEFVDEDISPSDVDYSEDDISL